MRSKQIKASVDWLNIALFAASACGTLALFFSVPAIARMNSAPSVPNWNPVQTLPALSAR